MISGLYVVTDAALSWGKTHVEIARFAVDGGASVIQLRDKTGSSAQLYEEACAIRDICRGKAVFIVNDRIDIALASGADGVHLGQSDLPLSVARNLCGPDFIIGISVGSMKEADAAVAAGASYVAVSPVYSTASKPDAGPGHGLSLVSAIHAHYPDVPLVGIGGLSLQNSREAVFAGLDAVAVISAVVSQPDIMGAARSLSAVIEEALHDRNE
ncbi:MAG TPA: thiamine phosphate synthase [Methanocorpusculum sp.]|nr:thiamine phosphate synthase [Methanocorpusculum sp.]